MDAAQISILVCAALAARCTLGLLLTQLQVRQLRRAQHTTPAELSGVLAPETLAKSLEYALLRQKFSMITGTINTVILLAAVLTGAFGMLDRWVSAAVGSTAPPACAAGALYVFAICLAVTAVQAPASWYSTFVIDAKYELTTAGVGLWLGDLCKALLVNAVLIALLIPLLMWIMHLAGAGWWLWAAAALFLFIQALAFVVPVWILPLFYKFQALPSAQLAEKVMALCRRLEYPVEGVYQVDASRRSKKANAFICGSGRTRRIALFDTLLNQMGDEEILAILAHEIGHHKRRHRVRLALLAAGQILLMFWLAGMLMANPTFYQAFGVDAPSDYTGLVLLFVTINPLLFLLAPIAAAFMRWCEYDADRFAAQAVGARELRCALAAVSASNLSEPIAHPLYAAFHDTHPRLGPRLTALT